LTSSTIGCATEPSEPAGVACPEIVAYSKEDQKRILDERLALPATAILNDVLRDYLQLRDRIRAACPGG
jgi:hypothetical protein